MKTKLDRVHLVLSKAYCEGLYIDTAWTTSAGAEQRIADLKASTAAFHSNSHLILTRLEIHLDTAGLPIVLHVEGIKEPADLGVHKPPKKSSTGRGEG